ncbi:MAG: hypothetical protein DRO01_07500 [Thermoproteota archaeon]|nr:MAG: hypothetical protein DRO01_07500 [Candidatus Korarchaeota archaeon]
MSDSSADRPSAALRVRLPPRTRDWLLLIAAALATLAAGVVVLSYYPEETWLGWLSLAAFFLVMFAGVALLQSSGPAGLLVVEGDRLSLRLGGRELWSEPLDGLRLRWACWGKIVNHALIIESEETGRKVVVLHTRLSGPRIPRVEGVDAVPPSQVMADILVEAATGRPGPYTRSLRALSLSELVEFAARLGAALKR